MLTQVGRAGAGDLAQVGDAFANQRGIAKGTGAQHAIDAFADQINVAVGLADGQFDVRVAHHELR
ncbi:hypothetical protein D3C78_1617260 [compost metagenome]